MTIISINGESKALCDKLVECLVKEIVINKYTASVVCYAGAEVKVDIVGKDSYEHRQAGATEVLACSSKRWALVKEQKTAVAPLFEELISRLKPVDIVLAIGFSVNPDVLVNVQKNCEIVAISNIDHTYSCGSLDRTDKIIDLILDSTMKK